MIFLTKVFILFFYFLFYALYLLIIIVIIIGNSGVGKTNILGRWMSDKFNYELPPTVVNQFMFKTFAVDGKLIRINFWDTGRR